MTESCEDIATLRLQLREAIWDGELEQVRQILDKYPTLIDIPTHDFGFSPLMDAVSSSERTPELVAIFLERGADAKTKTQEGYTALHCAIDINGPTCHGQMPEIIFRMLLDAGADLEAKQHWGWTPLMRAVIEGVEDEVQALCNLGARVDHVYPDYTWPKCMRGNTTIMASIYDPEKVKILLRAGADPFQRGLYGQNSIEHAEEQLIEVSEPEHKRKFGELMEQINKDTDEKLRSAGVSEEYITGRHANERLPLFDSESRLRESLCAMRSVTR